MNPTRPRRFGKSLFLDTLKELFEGNQALFAGLAVEPLSDWNKTYPVIRISPTACHCRGHKSASCIDCCWLAILPD